jgi:hypothetical protein
MGVSLQFFRFARLVDPVSEPPRVVPADPEPVDVLELESPLGLSRGRFRDPREVECFPDREPAGGRRVLAFVGALDRPGHAETLAPAYRLGGMSPRSAGATQHELSRIGLLAALPGQTLARLAQCMRREDVASGASVCAEGEDGDRFYVVLSGMLSVSQESRGPLSVLRPGDYFGEVALAMRTPRTASVRALTPATVASCNRATFDEFIRPLFADD